jgi:predicted transcriptional regulator|nr:MAG TPA: helix-turn-helix domain-containing protein [Caudoviricetes sp.]
MSKAVMLSIRPKWVEKIANGEKTIEVRKTRPKLDTPFKCYIYCTLQGCNEFFRVDLGGDVAKWNRGKWADRKGKVIGEFTCERIALIAYDGGELSSTTNAAFSHATCLTQSEIIAYIGDKGRCYGWHMSNLRIYDTPRELSEFTGLRDTRFGAAPYDIKRAPQSWCYVEAMDNG